MKQRTFHLYTEKEEKIKRETAQKNKQIEPNISTYSNFLSCSCSAPLKPLIVALLLVLHIFFQFHHGTKVNLLIV